MNSQDPPNGGDDDQWWQNFTAPGEYPGYDVNPQTPPYPFSLYNDLTRRPSQPQFSPYNPSPFAPNSRPFDFNGTEHGLYITGPSFTQYPEPPALNTYLPTSHNRVNDNGFDRPPPSNYLPPRTPHGLPVVLHQNNAHFANSPVTTASSSPDRVVDDTSNGRGGTVSLAHRVRPEILKSQKEDVVIESAGAASRRRVRRNQPKLARGNAPRELSRVRSNAGSPSNASPKPSTTYLFVSNSTDDPNRRGKKPPTQQQKLIQEQMVEIGGACIYCSEKRKICDLLGTCVPCQQARIRCVRGKGEFYLFEAPALHSVDKGSYKKAVEEAKVKTFKRICAALRDLPATIQLHHDPTSKIVLQVSTNPALPDESEHLELTYADLFDHSHEHWDNFSSKLVPTLRAFTDVARPTSFDHLTRKEPFNEHKLLRLIEYAAINVSVLQQLQYAKIYSAVGELPVATRLGSFICGSLVKDLVVSVDEVCDRLRERLRHKKGHYAETRYAIALYYLVLKCLDELKTDSSIDDILDPLRTRLSDVCSVVQSLFTKTQETLKNEQKRMVAALKMPAGDQRNAVEESINDQFVGMLDNNLDLQTFISIYALEIPQSTPLHFAFYVVHNDGLPVSSRASRQYNSFDHRSPATLAQLLHRTAVDPTLISQSSSDLALSSEATATLSNKPTLPKIETTFAAGPSSTSFLTTRNLSNFSPGPHHRSDFLSPSTAHYVHHPSLRTSQAGTAVCSSVESESTFAATPRVFEEPDLLKAHPTEDEKKYELDSLSMTHDKSGTTSFSNPGIKRRHSPDSDAAPSKRGGYEHMLNDMDIESQHFHESDFFIGLDEALGLDNATTPDAINKSKLPSSPLFSSAMFSD